MPLIVDASIVVAWFARNQASDHDLSAYDASYLDLALRLRYPVACRDSPLRGALRAVGAKLA